MRAKAPDQSEQPGDRQRLDRIAVTKRVSPQSPERQGRYDAPRYQVPLSPRQCADRQPRDEKGRGQEKADQAEQQHGGFPSGGA